MSRLSALELRIPPDLVWLAVVALMWVASTLTPGFDVKAPVRIVASGAFVAAGVALIVTARIQLRRARTTWHPSEPGRTTGLVTDGVYRLSRNPVYLGMLAILIAWSAALGSLLALALTALFVAYLDRFQIGPEERALSEIMGSEYRAYAGRVRRWL